MRQVKTKTPPKEKEVRKPKVVEHGLTSNRNFKTAELKKHQIPVENFLKSNKTSVILGDGGTSKDFVQMFRAIEGLNDGEFKRIVICKPIVEAGRSIGFLPGDLKEKTDVYLKSFYDNISKIVGRDNVNAILTKIQFEHVGFQRGNTLPEHSCIILSEVQNLTASEAHTYITRVPSSSKLYINGDASQSDLGMKSGLNDFLESISGVYGVGIAILDGEKHQMRDKQIIEITKKYIEIQKRKGNFFELDKNRFDYIDL